MIDWIKIRNEYINGNISYRKLAEKHNVNYNTLQDKARKEKWFTKKKEQHEKISEKTIQKTAEKLAKAEADRLLRISNAADKLLEKIELATEQLDIYLEKTRIKTPIKVKDKNTGKERMAFQEDEKLKEKQLARIDRAGLKQISSALKDLRDIQFMAKEETPQEAPTINITVSAATAEDLEIEENE